MKPPRGVTQQKEELFLWLYSTRLQGLLGKDSSLQRHGAPSHKESQGWPSTCYAIIGNLKTQIPYQADTDSELDRVLHSVQCYIFFIFSTKLDRIARYLNPKYRDGILLDVSRLFPTSDPKLSIQAFICGWKEAHTRLIPIHFTPPVLVGHPVYGG